MSKKQEKNVKRYVVWSERLGAKIHLDNVFGVIMTLPCAREHLENLLDIDPKHNKDLGVYELTPVPSDQEDHP